MCQTKRFIIVAVLSALVLTFSSIDLACGVKPAQTPTSPPVSTEPESGPWTSPQLTEQPPPTEPEIPANYTTYTDEAKLFSISYPSDWQTDVTAMVEIEKKAKESIRPKLGSSVESVSTIFLAGRRTERGYDPSVTIIIGPLPAGVSTHDEWIEAEMQGSKKAFPDFKEFSRVKTSVDGREATIVDWQNSLDGKVISHCLQMYTLVDQSPWVVTCCTTTGDFDKWKDDFDIVVRSLHVSPETE